MIVNVTSSDIKVLREGPGIIMSYFGNGVRQTIDIVSLRSINKTQTQAVGDFVSYLNAIPIER